MLWLRLLCVCCVVLATTKASQDNYQYHYGSDSDPNYYGVDDYDYGDYNPSDYDVSNDKSVQSGYADYDYNYDKPAKRKASYYPTKRRGTGKDTDYRRHNKPSVEQYGKSYQPKPKKEFVPVVIKKKQQKKRKILTTHQGFFIPGGTALFGKFKDLHSCKKACEITPTCFAGDFNPWLGKCFMHSNLTACASQRSHKALTHFKKVPCQLVETSRGIIVLGASVLQGIEIKGIDTLADCIKKCATAGGGIAATDAAILTSSQICCNIDYDFGSHKCFFHPCVNTDFAAAAYCADTVTAPTNSVPNPSAITITLCPLAT